MYFTIWLHARNFLIKSIINFEIGNISAVLIGLLLVSLYCFLNVFIRLFTSSTSVIEVLFSPSVILTAYVGTLAVISTVPIGLQVLSILYTTNKQVQIIQKHLHLCHSHTGIYSFNFVQNNEDETFIYQLERAYKKLSVFFRHLIDHIEKVDATLQIYGVTIYPSYASSTIIISLLTTILTAVVSLASF